MILQQKNFLYILLSGIVFLPISGYSQQTANPTANVPVTQTTVTPAGANPLMYNMVYDVPLNYVRTIVPDQPVSAFGASIKHRQITEFFDGLGRPLQTVTKRGHADGNDIVQHFVYDAAGRQSINYLPYARPAHQSIGLFDHLPKARLEEFYPAAKGQEPFSKTEFDNSPLNRPIKQLAPGKSWVGSGRGVQTAYRTNNSPNYFSGDIWNPIPTIITIGAFPIYRYDGGIQYQGTFGEGQLYITTTTDEDGNLSEEVKDKLGRLICTRVLARKVLNSDQPTGAPEAMFPNNYNYTFYVYDKLNRLRAVIPPGAVTCNYTKESSPPNLLPGFRKYHYSWTIPNESQQTGLCYFYHYDDRGRTIEKKIPGKEHEYFVYDHRDRLVLSQDGNLRTQGTWAFNFYDIQNRPTITGLVKLSDSRTDLQNQAIQQASSIPSNSWRNYVLNYSNPPQPLGLYPATILDGEILTYNYYDNYNLVNNLFDATKIPQPPSGDASIVASAYSDPTGRLTGTKIKVMNTTNLLVSKWINTTYYYDNKGRVIQTVANNLIGGTDYNSQLYYFQGMPYETTTHHHNPVAQPVPGSSAALSNIKLDKTYRRNLGQGGNEQVWRLQQAINDGAPYDLAYYDYDHMGRLVVKQYTMANVLQEYNIRGWIRQIHARNPYYQDSTYFKEDLYYDAGFTSKLYNGNIAGITWNNYGVIPASNTRRNAYGYSYDRTGRLAHAEYRSNPQLPYLWVNSNKDFTVSNISYDDRGNILSLNQRANNSNGPFMMDLLSYQYTANSNKLVKVTDGINANVSDNLPDFKDYANLTEEYTYDNNGNMLSDANKGIASITYNHLNKPVEISVSNQGDISYIYDALGNRLRKMVYLKNEDKTEVWDYVGDFVYKDNILQYILNEEGRSRPELVDDGPQSGATKFVYDYFIRDHLGNIRTTLAAEPATHEYYARHEIATANSEQLLFDNIAAVRDYKPGSINLDDTKAARLNASESNRRIGTAIMLRVMPGDQFTFATDAYYEEEENPKDSENIGAEEIVSSLLATLTGGTVGGKPVNETESGTLISNLFSRPETITGIEDLLNNSMTNGTAPKAGLNYLFFDEKMNLLSGSGRIAVEPITNGVFDNISTTRVSLDEPGYVIVYVDNQTLGKDVWFDNVQVLHYKTQVLEENHYYPFGLTFSTTAMGITPQPLKYNGKELETSLNLQTYEYGARQYNSQIGRWNGIDPLADKYFSISPFAYVANNPVMFIDPDGRTIEDPDEIIKGYKADINEQIAGISGFLEKGLIDKKAGGSFLTFLNDRLNAIKKLEKSDVVYRVTKESSYGNEGRVGYDGANSKVTIGFGSNVKTSLIGHEMEHAYQYEKNETSLSTGRSTTFPSLYDVSDETNAYNIERAFGYGIMFFSNPEAVEEGYPYKFSNAETMKFGAAMNPPAYQTIPQGPININSPQGHALRLKTALAGFWNLPVSEVYKGWQKDYKKRKK